MGKRRQYAAFLRGVMPTNARMSDLVRSFETAGFSDVATVLGSGNLVFTAPAAAESTIERKAEAAMRETLDRSFHTIVRTIDDLQSLLAKDPFAGLRLPPGSKCNVSLAREPLRAKRAFPIERDGARIVKAVGKEAFSVHVPSPRGPVFMALIRETFGDTVTTRTWDTIKKVVAKAGLASASNPRRSRTAR